MPTISIIIPTLNAGPNFAHVLAALHSQQLSPHEIIIIDSASIDQTLSVAKKARTKIISIPKHSFNHGRTRNLAISHSTGDLLLLLSQDALPADNLLLQNLAQNFSNPTVAAAYARHAPYPHHPPHIRQHVHEFSGSVTRRECSLPDPALFGTMSPQEQFSLCRFDNVCSMIRRGVWNDIPFAPLTFAEDLDWSRRALLAGHKIIYDPSALVIHSHNLNLRDYYRRTYQTHRALQQLFALSIIPRAHQIPRRLAADLCFQFTRIPRPAMDLPRVAAVPLHSLLNILATYNGARSARQTGTAKSEFPPGSTHPNPLLTKH